MVKRDSVLIIEDDATLLRGLRDNFESRGYRVRTADDGTFEARGIGPGKHKMRAWKRSLVVKTRDWSKAGLCASARI